MKIYSKVILFWNENIPIKFFRGENRNGLENRILKKEIKHLCNLKIDNSTINTLFFDNSI
jgi:hypothetical protein